MAPRKFFEERSEQSAAKARIVTKYFAAWARVIAPTAKRYGGKIAYIDLYAGPGRYKDGAASTPLLVLEHAIGAPDLPAMLITHFNDGNKDHSNTLQSEIDNLPGIKKLKYKPHVACGEIDEEAADFFAKTHLVPAFSFVDPFGYKGLSLNIITGVIKDWGCDCVFFFNYTRINAGINNPKVDKHIDALFGQDRAEHLRKLLPTKRPHEREAIILEEIAQAIKAKGGTYVLPFRFKNEAGTRTSHSLVFVSKHFKGYEIMKDIMAKESSTVDQGVPSFVYSPADESTPLLFSLSRPLDALEGMLLDNFAGQTLSMQQIYMKHSVDRPYLKKNYKDALLKLESKKKITAKPSDRRAGTFADDVLVTFPRRPAHKAR